MKNLYALLLIFSLLFPLLFSFERKWISYYRKYSSLFPAIIIVALIFIIWDVWFTRMGVWSFNEEYVSGYFLFSLPLEEWMFFIVIPYSCVFIYESFKFFVKKEILSEKTSFISAYFISAVLLIIGLLNWERIYTCLTFVSTALFIIVHIRLLKSRYWGHFLIAYLIHLIPFGIVNGILTSMPVVLYNDAENFGIRMGTIPIEDSIYSMLLLLMNITIYEWLNEKYLYKTSKELSTQ